MKKLFVIISVSRKILVHAAMVLMLAGSFFSCLKKVESDGGGNVPYKPCDCSWIEFGEPMKEKGYRKFKDVYLFKDDVPEQMFTQMHELSKRKQISYIVFNSDTDHVGMDILPIQGSGNIISTGRICNFPDFAKEWTIPQNGVKVDVEGVTYEACWGGGVLNKSYFDYILKSFKKK